MEFFQLIFNYRLLNYLSLSPKLEAFNFKLVGAVPKLGPADPKEPSNAEAWFEVCGGTTKPPNAVRAGGSGGGGGSWDALKLLKGEKSRVVDGF